MRYFRDRLNRRKVDLKVKHYEDCEQLVNSVGRMHVVEAALTFFNMDAKEDKPKKNIPPAIFLLSKPDQEAYFNEIMDKFVDAYFIIDREDTEHNGHNTADKVNAYALNLLRHFIILEDFRDAVRQGDGERLSSICKELLLHFKTIKGFNAYAIEMLTNLVQNEVLLLEQQSEQSKWAATTNWKGGVGKNVEIDLMQEINNCSQKNLIRGMGANKTEQAITRASKASGGMKKIVENFDTLTDIKQPSSHHTHKSSQDDELKILNDLRELRPFEINPGRSHASFPNINADPLHDLDMAEMEIWLARHTKNLVMGYQGEVSDDDSISDDEQD